MDQKYFDEIKAREQKTTPGPWKVGNGSKKCGFNGANVIVAIKSNQPYVVMDRAIYPKETKFNKQVLADMKFAARARTDIPALLSEVECFVRDKVSKALKGRKFFEQHKANLSLALRGRFAVSVAFLSRLKSGDTCS